MGTKLYLKIMYEMGRLAEGVAQIINVKDNTMCHGVASELLTNIKKFAGSTLPQQLQMYQSHNHQSFGYMDLPRLNMSGFGPTAPMTSTGINNGNANGIGNELLRQQLIGKLAQINYMQQLNAMTNMNPFATINPMQFQQPHTHNIDSSQIYLQNQSNLIQQQMNDLNQRSNQQTFNNPMQSRMRSTTEPLQQNKLQQNNVKQINEEYDKLLAKVEANKKNKKKKKKTTKKTKKTI